MRAVEEAREVRQARRPRRARRNRIISKSIAWECRAWSLILVLLGDVSGKSCVESCIRGLGILMTRILAIKENIFEGARKYI